MSSVLIIVMPFGALDAPQVGAGTLQAELRARGIACDIAYLNLSFARGIGIDAYTEIGLTAGEGFLGEWLFARSLFSDQELDSSRYINELLLGQGLLPPSVVKRALGLRDRVPGFLDHCLGSISWERYTLVGFTSMFEQNLASLALARRIKERYPRISIAMGGANCFGPMGEQLHRSFEFLDYVFTGEADLAFPDLVECLAAGRAPGDEIKGYVRREAGKSVSSGPADCLGKLDRLPYPDYDDFFEQYLAYGLPRSMLGYVLMETSRGCWWGAKNQCRFCAIHVNEMPFRSKSPRRAIDEMQHLATRYHTDQLMTVDNILDLRFFKTLIPELRRRQSGLHLFYESKANLRESQVRELAEAGIIGIQPGIESFGRNALKLMHKGVSPLQNAALLKWCRQYGVIPWWNLLFGFPGETLDDYEANIEFARTLMHCEPPMGFGEVRLERFSPLLEKAQRFGLRRIRPARPYKHIYPFAEDVLSEIAFYFEFDFDGKAQMQQWRQPLEAELTRWKAVSGRCDLRVVQAGEEWLRIADTRPARLRSEYLLRDLEKDVATFCDRPRSFSEILVMTQKRSIAQNQSGEQRLRDLLRQMVEHRLMLKSQDSYLSVILPLAEPRSTGAGLAPMRGDSVCSLPTCGDQR